MAKVMIQNVLRFLAMIAIQVVLFKNIWYYNLASPFPYILIILLLPLSTSNFFLYLLAFGTGLAVDAFYDSLGIHTAACVALAWFRIAFVRVTLEMDVRQSSNSPSWGELGSKWYVSYVFFSILIHHFVLFVIEVFSFHNFLQTIGSIVLSSLSTFVIVMLISLLFYKRKSRLGI